MEHNRTAKTAEPQRFLDCIHIGEIRIGATHRIIPSQQTVAGIRYDTDGVVAVVAVSLSVTGVHIDRHIVIAVPRHKRAQWQGGRITKTKVSIPRVCATVEQLSALIVHFHSECP